MLVSAASIWEVAIKRAIGKLEIRADFMAAVREADFAELPIGFEHAEAAGELPRHHGDPFDRMLVAQAMLEGAVLVTADPTLATYGVPILPAAE